MLVTIWLPTFPEISSASCPKPMPKVFTLPLDFHYPYKYLLWFGLSLIFFVCSHNWIKQLICIAGLNQLNLECCFTLFHNNIRYTSGALFTKHLMQILRVLQNFKGSNTPIRLIIQWIQTSIWLQFGPHKQIFKSKIII